MVTEYSGLGASVEGQREALALCDVGLESVSTSHGQRLLEDHMESPLLFW